MMQGSGLRDDGRGPPRPQDRRTMYNILQAIDYVLPERDYTNCRCRGRNQERKVLLMRIHDIDL